MEPETERVCTSCGREQGLDQFQHARVYEQRRGILTTRCQTCRDQVNERTRRWYNRKEKERKPMQRRGDWIQTFTGVRFYPLDPDVSEVRIVDIANSLGMTVRFGGHVNRFYSVAQHSVHVSQMVPDHLKLPALLHDAAEAYLVDMPRPIKSQPEFAGLKKIEARLEVVIAERFGFAAALMHAEEVKKADLVALATEARDLMSADPKPGEAWAIEQPAEQVIEPLSPLESGRLFLDAFHQYGGIL